MKLLDFGLVRPQANDSANLTSALTGVQSLKFVADVMAARENY